MLAIAPINGNGGSLNDIFILELRSDYLIHALQFLPWMIFGMKMSKPILYWLIAGLFFASITEGIQYFLTYRSFNINDLIANLIGVLLGTLTFLLKLINRKT
jgi:VanZ family protein